MGEEDKEGGEGLRPGGLLRSALGRPVLRRRLSCHSEKCGLELVVEAIGSLCIFYHSYTVFYSRR